MREADQVVAELRRRGELWESAPGLVGLRGDVLALYRAIERRVAAIVLTRAPDDWRVPAGIAMDTLARAEYFQSFPQWLTAAGHLSDDPARLAEVAGADDPAEAARHAIEPAEIALAPAVCYHVYAGLAGRVVESPTFLTAQATCWRHEGESLRPLERGWAFTMRELVCLGDADAVESFARWGVEQAMWLACSLGLEARVDAATDPFFAPTARGKALLQRVKGLKLELLLPIGAYRSSAAASFNRHQSFFGESFDIRLPDGAPAMSGCVAFGLERWLLAYLIVHGPDASAWPIFETDSQLMEVT